METRCFSFEAKKHTENSLVWEAFSQSMKVEGKQKARLVKNIGRRGMG